ncbi:hypothetical protein [Streptodolium elevatio]|uniref:Uncharacterized protein n=1 Tax=Streptodolium elevatio TaxID=3157996 RepID=A0ABV3DRW6_9ACTN
MAQEESPNTPEVDSLPDFIAAGAGDVAEVFNAAIDMGVDGGDSGNPGLQNAAQQAMAYASHMYEQLSEQEQAAVVERVLEK